MTYGDALNALEVGFQCRFRGMQVIVAGVEVKRIRFVCQSEGKAPWLVLVEGKRGSKSHLTVERNLIMYNREGKPTDEFRAMFGDYMDGCVYQNSPVHYMANLPADHYYVGLYNSQKSVICVGLGAWEQPESTRALDASLKRKGINTWVDYWGFDCDHDWPWWRKQLPYFLEHVLGSPY